MTTGSGKKAPKISKAPARHGQRKKIVAKAPAPVEIDKEKMAAFFSAAGADNSAPNSEKETIEVVVPTDTIATDKNSDNEKGEAVGTSIPPTTSGGSDSGSYSVLPMVFVLAVLALFWFYYISSTPLKKAAVAQFEQGKVKISALMSRIGILEAEVVRLKAKRVVFEKASQKPKKITKKVVTPVKSGVVVKGSSVPATDSSFDKAPIPFWQQMKRGSLAQPRKEMKPAVKTPVVKVDSFNKAPKPFWLKPRVKPEAAKVKKEVKLPAPPAAKVAPKPKKLTVKHEPDSAPVLDPSFKKAPKPFWLKD